MEIWINGLLLVGVLGLPTAIVYLFRWALGRRGIDTHIDPPDVIDYDKW
jgi:hypothetical protein